MTRKTKSALTEWRKAIEQEAIASMTDQDFNTEGEKG